MAVHKVIRSTRHKQIQQSAISSQHSVKAKPKPQENQQSALSSQQSVKPQPQAAKAAQSGSPSVGESGSRCTNHQVKAELFSTLERLNRGYGIALAALDRLRGKDRLPGKRVFPVSCLNDFRNRTEVLRALANRDLLRLLAEHEEQDAVRFGPE